MQAALLEMLDNWIDNGTTPAASRYLELTATNTLARDADGNVIGGIRPPDIQVPLGATVERTPARASAGFSEPSHRSQTRGWRSCTPTTEST